MGKLYKSCKTIWRLNKKLSKNGQILNENEILHKTKLKHPDFIEFLYLFIKLIVLSAAQNSQTYWIFDMFTSFIKPLSVHHINNSMT